MNIKNKIESNYSQKKGKFWVEAIMLVLASAPFNLWATDSDEHYQSNHRAWEIQGKATTGPNDVCNVPQWELPSPFGPAHFTLLGAYDDTPGATQAIKLSKNNCDPSIVLATTIDPNFQAFFGWADPDPRLTNLPLRNVPTIAGFDDVRGELAKFASVPANPLPPTYNSMDKPITLGDWLKAKSTMQIRCLSDGSAEVSAKFSHLIANGLYGMYGIWKTKMPGSSNPTFLPVTFGGFPHLLTANIRGEAEFYRKLDFCPKVPSPDGSILMFVDLAYHSDGISHGAFPFTPSGLINFRDSDGNPYQSTEPPGTVTHVQIGFPVNVTPLPTH